jgi:hypothetical protein
MIVQLLSPEHAFGNTASIVAANESEMATPKLELTI